MYYFEWVFYNLFIDILLTQTWYDHTSQKQIPLYQWIIRYGKYIIDNKIYDNVEKLHYYILCVIVYIQIQTCNYL